MEGGRRGALGVEPPVTFSARAPQMSGINHVHTQRFSINQLFEPTMRLRGAGNPAAERR